MTTYARDREIRRRFCRGETQAELASEFCISDARVRQILKVAGITGRDGGAHVRAEAKHERAVDMYADGEPFAAVVAKLGPGAARTGRAR